MHAITDNNPKLTPAFVQKLANLVFTLRETCDVAYHVGYTDNGHASGISSMSEGIDTILWDAMRQLANGVEFMTVKERVRGAAYNLGRHAGIRDGNISIDCWIARTISHGVIVSSDRFPRLDDARRHAMTTIDAMADTDTTVQVLIIPVLPDGTLGGVWETFHPGQC